VRLQGPGQVTTAYAPSPSLSTVEEEEERGRGGLRCEHRGQEGKEGRAPSCCGGFAEGKGGESTVSLIISPVPRRTEWGALRVCPGRCWPSRRCRRPGG